MCFVSTTGWGNSVLYPCTYFIFLRLRCIIQDFLKFRGRGHFLDTLLTKLIKILGCLYTILPPPARISPTSHFSHTRLPVELNPIYFQVAVSDRWLVFLVIHISNLRV